MKREILFRGKRVDNGEWVYGLLTHDLNDKTENCLSISPNWTTFNEVIPETVGQFTGLMDKNGNKIFEGDHFGNNQYSVSFSDGVFTLGGIPLKGYFNLEYMTQLSIIKGNIHDNPTT